jgi:hypothetical protein
MRSEDIHRKATGVRPRLEATLLSRITADQDQGIDESVDAVHAELREVAEQLRRAGLKLAAIEAMEGIDRTALRVATTHVRLYCRPTGYAFEEADEPPPPVGELVGMEDGAFVVERFGPSPLPGDCRRCAILVSVAPSEE